MIAGIRPEHFEDAEYGEDTEGGLRFKTTVDVVESMGSELYAYFDIKGTQEVHSEQLDELAADAGMDDVPGGGASHVVARLDARSAGRARQGGRGRPRHLPDQALRHPTAATVARLTS